MTDYADDIARRFCRASDHMQGVCDCAELSAAIRAAVAAAEAGRDAAVADMAVWMEAAGRAGVYLPPARFAAAKAALVREERERCAVVASQEGPCCYHQGCHEAIAAKIREGKT